MKEKIKKYWWIIAIILVIGGTFYWFIFRTSKDVNKSHEIITGELTNEEINEISKSIVMVECWADFNKDGYVQDDEFVYGSGTYIHRELIDGKKLRDSFSYLDGYVLTNGHIAILENDMCDVSLVDPSIPIKKGYMGPFFYDKNTHFLNDNLDIALLREELSYNKQPVVRPSYDDNYLKEHLLKNYSFCPKDKIIGSKVYIFGYPITGGEYKKLLSSDILVRNLIVSTGIISGVDSHENYYTDAKIDSGSSGGLAVSRINNKICIVGVPTWISGGEFETLGMIQPFWKVLDVFKIIEL